MTPQPSLNLSEAFDEALRSFSETDPPKADFSLDRATELVRADRDGRATT